MINIILYNYSALNPCSLKALKQNDMGHVVNVCDFIIIILIIPL